MNLKHVPHINIFHNSSRMKVPMYDIHLDKQAQTFGLGRKGFNISAQSKARTTSKTTSATTRYAHITKATFNSSRAH